MLDLATGWQKIKQLECLSIYVNFIITTFLKHGQLQFKVWNILWISLSYIKSLNLSETASLVPQQMSGRIFVVIFFFWAILTIVTPTLILLSENSKTDLDSDGKKEYLRLLVWFTSFSNCLILYLLAVVKLSMLHVLRNWEPIASPLCSQNALHQSQKIEWTDWSV